MISAGPSISTSSAGAQPSTVCVSSAILAHARATPDRVAVIDGETVLTYSQLLQRAQSLSHQSGQLGLIDTLIGVASERSAAAVAALLGILLSRNAFVPLDLDAPAQRLAFQLADARVSAVVASDAARPKLAGFAGPIVAIGALPSAPAAELTKLLVLKCEVSCRFNGIHSLAAPGAISIARL